MPENKEIRQGTINFRDIADWYDAFMRKTIQKASDLKYPKVRKSFTRGLAIAGAATVMELGALFAEWQVLNRAVNRVDVACASTVVVKFPSFRRSGDELFAAGAAVGHQSRIGRIYLYNEAGVVGQASSSPLGHGLNPSFRGRIDDIGWDFTITGGAADQYYAAPNRRFFL